MAVLASSVVEPLWAEQLNEPFRTVNRNPLVQVYGLPVAQSAHITADEQMNAALTLEASNNFAVNQRGSELIYLDGETYRADLNWRYGIGDFEIGLSLPLISHQAGGMDGFIEDWHDAFNLPEGDRIDYPKDELRYAYSQGGILALDMQDNGEGLGDASLALGYQLSATEQRSWALRAGIKLATGEVENLRGSDAQDAYLSLHLSEHSLYADHGISWHASVGSLWLGDGEVLPALQRDQVWFGSTTLAWAYTPNWSVKIQVDAHSAFYDSELKQIGDDSAQLLLGASVKLSDKLVMDFSVNEDIAVETAPDVVFQIGLRMGQW